MIFVLNIFCWMSFPVQHQLDKIIYIGSPLEIRENFMFDNMAI